MDFEVGTYSGYQLRTSEGWQTKLTRDGHVVKYFYTLTARGGVNEASRWARRNPVLV